MKTKVEISDNSIETAGLPTDYKEAICEFIWNSFDAKATFVKIDFDTKDPIGNLPSFSIGDNGEGIEFRSLNETFGRFLDSQKKKGEFTRTSYVHGRKGKGRFSFEAFATKAKWDTVYRDGDDLKEFSVAVDASDKDFYDPTTPKVSIKKETGTKLVFQNIHSITVAHLSSEDFKSFLRFEYGWFLHLNRKKKYEILINGQKLDYEKIIAETETVEYEYKNEGGENNKFSVNYIRWHDKIGEKFYFYFLNNEKIEKAKKLTSFNNKGDEFYHSVFVESPYFEDFTLVEEKKLANPLFGKNQTDSVFRDLSKDLQNLLSRKRKEFIRRNSGKIIDKFESDGVMPSFNDNLYGQARKDDFEEVVKEIYATEPKIFTGLGKEQQKTFLGMLNLVLDTDERDNIIKIMDSVVSLGPEERKSLADILNKTSLSKIVRTIKLIEQRYGKVEALKNLVFDLKKFTNERDHIQAIIEDNYWLFGEQYSLVSADVTFENALSEYLYIVDGKDGEKDKYKMDHPEKVRRPDIFVCRKRSIPDSRDEQSEIEENLIVELKTPTIVLGKKEFRQVLDYLDIVIKEPRFNSQTRRWKFFLVSNQVDEYIKQQYTAFEGKGKLYLVYQVEKYEVYSMTWDDVFRNFEIRHRYLLEKLEFDKVAIQEEFLQQGIKLGRENSDTLTEQILEMKTK